VTILTTETIDAYHRHDAISNSKLKTFRRSPLLYHKAYVERSVQIADSDALRVGRAFDCLLFDGRDVYQRIYAVKPQTYENEKGEVKKWTRSAKVCERWEDAQTMLGRTVISHEHGLLCQKMLVAVQSNPFARALLSQGAPQLTFRRHALAFGLEVQTRPDWFSEKPIDIPELGLTSNGRPYIVDLKTTEDFDDWYQVNDPESPRTGKAVIKNRYDMQAALGQWIIAQEVGPTAHFLLVQEKAEPTRTATVCMDDEYLDMAFAEVSLDLNRLRACKDRNVWPGSPDRVITLHAKDWQLEAASRRVSEAAHQGHELQAVGA
jgi:hypothetical protein